ncbi:DUF6801 domain-containing protein [Amycolatopsis anabasis]|uniref:DUF6801 domain-containing protein n=1 Tax=Amycolatopsis anabasis TaxID=1840409 RepID=UPI00131EB62A|nr:DUF6801 domain-containing protein [Amycolatopsis anabasis]
MTATKAKRANRRLFRAGIVTAVAMAATGVLGAGTAGAADKALTWKGGFPVIGDQSVKSVIHVDIPAKVSSGQAVSVPFSIDVDAGAGAGDGLRLVGAKKLAGTIKSSVTLTASNGQSVPLKIELPIPDTEVPKEGPLTFAAKGSVDFKVPAGVPAGPAKTAVDAKATSHIVTDSLLGEFDVNLVLDPPDQDTVLGTTEVG